MSVFVEAQVYNPQSTPVRISFTMTLMEWSAFPDKTKGITSDQPIWFMRRGVEDAIELVQKRDVFHANEPEAETKA